VNYRTAQDWVAWYRQGGLAEVVRHIPGHASRGRRPYLSAAQQKALARRVASGTFRSVGEVIDWVKQRWGVTYTPDGMYAVLARHHARLKGPRPRAAKADPQQQADWKKGG
jgi:transposase